MWFFRKWGLFGTIYIIVGIVIAWLHHYITVHLLLLILSALLAMSPAHFPARQK